LNFISKSALKQATHWVKKESEAAPDARIPDIFASEHTKTEEKQVVGAGAFESR
jgi:hypothetical protein